MKEKKKLIALAGAFAALLVILLGVLIAKYVEKKKLDKWTHNKAIQKSVESNRISPERKEYLKSLKQKR